MSQLCDPLVTLTAMPSSASKLQESFRASPYFALRQLTCDVDADRDRIVVHGALPSYYLKQVAHTVALKTCGVGRVSIDIAVVSGALAQPAND